MIGVIADDTTGANDIGVMFAKHGYLTQIATWLEDETHIDSGADVIVIDTDSRLEPPEIAYRKVFAATKRLVASGCTPLYKKTCSVFRGNIGAELDAMLDASGGSFAMVSVAFPKNGRRTVQGIHTVNGKRLEASAFAHDPVHPTLESDLVKLLAAQTRRRVSLIDLATVQAGTAALRAAIFSRGAYSNYCIFDASEQSDLTALAAAAHDFPFMAGSSALAEELPKFWPPRKPVKLLAEKDFSAPHNVLIVSGSLTPQTKSQTAALAAAGVPTVTLDTRQMFAPASRPQEIVRVIDEVLGYLRAGHDALVMADQSMATVAATKSLGAQRGLDPLATSKAVSTALAEVTLTVIETVGIKRLIVAGGDTSSAVCRQLGILGNYILEEISPGVPSGLAIGREMLLVLKSGSFGADDFLVHATAHLKTLGHSTP
ncbi:MAG: four-carbon acid sugar kinase family protein [Lacunisphaera sp.]|nr:four-carbon acid sugar kinase family protein [Lacunisphaera sp.]